MNKVVLYLLILLFIVLSNQSIFISFSFLDEILLVLIFLFYIIDCLITKRKLIRNTTLNVTFLLIFVLYIMITLISLSINQYQMQAYIMEIFNNIKPLIILFFFVNLKISENITKILMNSLIIANIPSILIAFTDLIKFYVLNINSYHGFKERYGLIRLEGLSGHPITLGFILMILVIWIHHNYSKNTVLKLLIVFLLLMQFLTFSRLPLVLTISYFIIVYFNTIKDVLIKKVILISVVIITIFVLPYFYSSIFESFLEDEAEHTI